MGQLIAFRLRNTAKRAALQPDQSCEIVFFTGVRREVILEGAAPSASAAAGRRKAKPARKRMAVKSGS